MKLVSNPKRKISEKPCPLIALVTEDGNSLLLWHQRWRHVSTWQDGVFISGPGQIQNNAKQTFNPKCVFKHQASWKGYVTLQTFSHGGGGGGGGGSSRCQRCLSRLVPRSAETWKCRLICRTCWTWDPDLEIELTGIAMSAIGDRGTEAPRYNHGVTIRAVVIVIVTSSEKSNVKSIALMVSNVEYVSIVSGC